MESAHSIRPVAAAFPLFILDAPWAFILSDLLKPGVGNETAGKPNLCHSLAHRMSGEIRLATCR